MTNNLLIFLGAGLGGVLRYWVSSGAYYLLGRSFPYGTLLVNISGCFLIGLLFTVLSKHFDSSNINLRALLLIGFLGGYTTFSSFSLETLKLLENNHWLSAVMNVLLNIFTCLLVVWFGVILGKSLHTILFKLFGHT